jgi:hypothetical protein
MNSCHSLETSDGSLEMILPFSLNKSSADVSWNGRRVAVIQERCLLKQYHLNPDEELLQKLLHRSILNLPDGPFQIIL